MIQVLLRFSRRGRIFVTILLLQFIPVSVLTASAGSQGVMPFQVEVLPDNILSAMVDKNKRQTEGLGIKEKGRSVKEVFTTLKFDNEDVSTAFKKIENATSFGFSYNIKDVKGKKVSGDFINQSLYDILISFSRQLDLNFRQYNDMINVKVRKERSQSHKAEEVEFAKVVHTVQGAVTDNIKGEPLPGVNVMVKDTNIGAVTDVDGKYSLVVPDENSILVFSFIGYTTQEVSINGRSIIDVALAEHVQSLDEVVVIGYGVQEKVNVTGSVDVIKGEVFQNRQSPTVSQLLQGVSPGLTFSVGNFGLQPGASLDVRLRGTGSINGGDGPYVIIDGIPGDMNRLNPNDIASISVLKDAAASAIYGARAPYGVILITTKSGSVNEKFSVTYSTNISRATAQNLPRQLNSYLHTRVMNEAGVAGGGGRYYSNQVIDNIRAYQAGDYDYIRDNNANFPMDATHFETIPSPINPKLWGTNEFGNSNRDWFDEWYGSALNQQHNLSLQGGNRTTSFYFSAGLLDQEGVLNYGTDTFDRFNIQGKVKTAITDWWDFTYQPRFSKTAREYPNMDSQGTYDLMFHFIAITSPTFAKYDGYGNYMLLSKIPFAEDAGTDRIEIAENWQNFYTDLRPAKGLTIHSDFAYRVTDEFQSSQNFVIYNNGVDKTPTPWGPSTPSYINNSHVSDNYWTTNNYISYEHNLNEVHHFKILGGMQFERANNRSLFAQRINILVPEVPSLETASGDPTVGEGLHSWATQGYFGRLTYDYKGKYLLESNVRYDGTSRFREGKRWGFFPSFSAGWNVHYENFWESIEEVVNTFKIRGSWGELGNFGNPDLLSRAASFPDRLLIPLSSGNVNWIFNRGQSRPIGFAGTPGLVNPDVTWETARTINLGLNLSFLENKLQTDFDFFDRTTFDQLGKVEAQPGVIGSALPQANNVTLSTRGWELSLRWQQSINSGSYNIGINLYDNKSTIVKYLNPTGTLSDYYEGQVLGEIWGYTANSLYRTREEVEEYTNAVDLTSLTGLGWNTGDVKYQDINNDGAVDNGANTITDHGDWKIIGNSTPRLQFGIIAALNYRGFDFSMLWKGVAKRDLSMGASANFFWGFRNGVQSTIFPEHLDYFRDTPGDEYTGVAEGEANFNLDAYFPRPYLVTDQNNKNRITSTRYLQSGAYIRLQNIQLGYNLPQDLLSKLRLQKFRMYVSGENLLTLSKLPPGIDPIALRGQFGEGKTYGAERILSVGINVTY